MFAISTSSKSKNVIEGCKAAKEMEIKVISLTGKSKNTPINKYSDLIIRAPSHKVSRIRMSYYVWPDNMRIIEKNIK